MQVHGSTNEDKGDNFDVEEKRRMGQRGRDLIVHRYIIINLNSLHRSFLLIRTIFNTYNNKKMPKNAIRKIENIVRLFNSRRAREGTT